MADELTLGDRANGQQIRQLAYAVDLMVQALGQMGHAMSFCEQSGDVGDAPEKLGEAQKVLEGILGV